MTAKHWHTDSSQVNKYWFTCQSVHTPGLSGGSVRPVSRSLGWEAHVCDAQIVEEPSWHRSVVMQPREVHGQTKAAKLDLVIVEFVLQLPRAGSNDKMTSNYQMKYVQSSNTSGFRDSTALHSGFRISVRKAPHPRADAKRGRAMTTQVPQVIVFDPVPGRHGNFFQKHYLKTTSTD